MYGGYGNSWGQAAAAWAAGGNASLQGQPNQNQAQNHQQQQQQSVFNSTTTHQAYQQQQQQQQTFMAYGGNMVANPAAAGMMNYMNMGVAANPFMNYGGNMTFANPSAAVNNTTTSTPWVTNQQQYQQFPQAFPGGRPPLPPGPPPPDKPKVGAVATTASTSNQPPPPPPAIAQNRQNQAAPPPPPPPPPAKQLNANAVSFNDLKPEDAYNIIKSAAALGMIPASGPLAPLTSLNVSEELFGSKSRSSSGIPGLDMTEDEKLLDSRRSPEPELIDLEKDDSRKKGPEKKVTKSWSDLKSNPDGSSKQPDKDAPSSSKMAEVSKPPPAPEFKKEVVWELRPEIQNQDWKTNDSKGSDNNSAGNLGKGQPKSESLSNIGWKIDQQKPANSSVDQVKPVSKAPGSDSGLSSNTNTLSSHQSENENSNANDDKQQGPPVRIPLEAADGKELVYDRKTLKQFDQKFREWEADFEKWKKSNERHPDKRMYQQYLNQWNLWREQLIEQRRSILDTMTKAKLDSTESFVSKIMEKGMFSGDAGEGDDYSNDKFSEVDYFDTTSNSSQTGFKGFVGNETGQSKGPGPLPNQNTQKQTENPFDVAMKSLPAPELVKRTPPAAPSLSKLIGSSEVKPMGSAPAQNSPFGGNQSSFDPKGDMKNKDRERPVERILRDGGGGKNNMFEKSSCDVNPFDTSASFGGERTFNNFRNEPNPPKPKINEEASRDETSLPFEWSLPSQSQPKQDKNPFDISQNPFMQPTGPNPFEVKEEQRLPSLDDFIKRTNLDFTTPVSISTHQSSTSSSNNIFSWPATTPNSTEKNSSSNNQAERILRDPMDQPKSQNQSAPQTPAKSIRLEPNPVGMPLLIAAKEDPPSPKNELDKISHLFSRDRGPAPVDNNENSKSHVDDDDLFGEDTEVIDFAAGGADNSVDDMDFPRGENPNDNKEDDDDFFLEDSEVIDYSKGIPPEELANLTGSGADPYAEGYGYGPGFEHGYPPPEYYGPVPRGRGRGRGFPPSWAGRGRGYPPPGHPYWARGMPPGMRPPYYPPEYGPMGMGYRGRPYGRGMPMGRGGVRPPGYDPHAVDWYQHDSREEELAGTVPVADPEVVEISPSPSPEPFGPKPPPHVKIAPPNPDFERDARRSRSRSRSRSRERSTRGRDRSRSRDRDRVSRRGRDSSPSDRRDRDRRRDDSSRRDRSRDRDRRSPVRRDRYDDRERGRDRDRDRDRDRYSRDRKGRSKSRSKSPAGDRNTVTLVRNPLFPSVSSTAGMHGAFPASNPPPPRYQTILIEDILNKPGRSKRPPRIVIFMRGLPGSGKSHIVKLIKEREVEMGGKAPRILSLDNYFTTEIEKKEKDPITGVEEKKTVMEYEYDEEREPLYRAQLVRQFKKTLDEGYFSFVIVDCVNEFVRQFEEMAQFATLKRFQAYVAEIEESVDVCFKRNVHKRTREEIMKINRVWEKTPSQFIKLDTRTLLQDEAVQDVEMEDVSDVEADLEKSNKRDEESDENKPPMIDLELEDIEDEDSGDNLLASAASSKWDSLEPSEEKLNKLDGLMKRRKSGHEDADVDSEPSIENWLKSNLPEDYIVRRQSVPGQKRVRWADIEERREQEIMREVGFVVGHTDWNRMMDPTFGSSALTKTKFI